MRITVSRLKQGLGGETVATVRSLVGEFRGLWRSVARPPEVGAEFLIELDIAPRLEELLKSVPGTKSFRAVEEARGIALTGLVDAVHEDGVFFFRLGPDSLTMIESEPGSVVLGEWISLVVPVSELSLFPFDRIG